jgi:hypothetical protein
MISQSGSCCPNVFFRALCAYERAGVKNFTKKIVRQNSRVDTTLALEIVTTEIKPLEFDTFPK